MYLHKAYHDLRQALEREMGLYVFREVIYPKNRFEHFILRRRSYSQPIPEKYVTDDSILRLHGGYNDTSLL